MENKTLRVVTKIQHPWVTRINNRYEGRMIGNHWLLNNIYTEVLRLILKQVLGRRTDRQTDRPKDGQPDIVTFEVPCMRLKSRFLNNGCPNCFFLLKSWERATKKRVRGYLGNLYLDPMTQMVHQTTTWGTSQIKNIFIKPIGGLFRRPIPLFSRTKQLFWALVIDSTCYLVRLQFSPFLGFCMDILRQIKENLSLTVEIQEETEWGRYKNG